MSSTSYHLVLAVYKTHAKEKDCLIMVHDPNQDITPHKVIEDYNVEKLAEAINEMLNTSTEEKRANGCIS